MRDGSYAESEAYDSASVLPIHTRSELSSDSDSAYDSVSVASVASVNQPLILLFSRVFDMSSFIFEERLCKRTLPEQRNLQGRFYRQRLPMFVYRRIYWP